MKEGVRKPPIARKDPQVLKIHGQTIIDDYAWMRDKDSKEVLDYLKDENRYTDDMLSPFNDLHQQIFDEMVGRINEDDRTVPYRIRDYLYYHRTEKGKQYEIHCRKKFPDGPEEILLDENLEAEKSEFFALGTLKISPDDRYLAWSADRNGSERFTLKIKDLKTGEFLSDILLDTYYSVEWANDGKHIFYVSVNEAMRPHKVFRHALGTHQDEDVEAFHETDDRFHVTIGKSKNSKYLFIHTGSQITSEVLFANAFNHESEFKPIIPREHGVEYDVVHHHDHFYVLTNDEALDFRLMRTPVTGPGKHSWVEVISHSDTEKLEGVESFRNHLVIYSRKNGFTHLRILDVRTMAFSEVNFPEPVYTFWPGENPDPDLETVRIHYSSLISPRSVYAIHLETGEWELLKQYEVKGGYDKEDYHSRRLFATARDGTKIPVSIIYRKDTPLDGSAPLLLYAYGAYGSNTDPYFSSTRLSLLDRGFIYAIAHVRGGSEMGREWYESGKLKSKKNTFTDFIDCAGYLIRQKYTSSEGLCARGGSAGGLLMGAVVNEQPDLFKAVIANVPFVDVLNTMLDDQLPLTTIEWEEWGNPQNPDDFDYIKAYSPYDNVKETAYPHMLVIAGFNDPRVGFWEPAKWVARLRQKKTDNNMLLLRTNMDAGHAGASGRYDFLSELAEEYTFLLIATGKI